MPAIIELRHALLTNDNLFMFCEHNRPQDFHSLQDYQIEIAYDVDNRPVKMWIHDSKGKTLLRIQVKP